MRIQHEPFKPGASIIIPCKNEGPNVRMTVDSVLAALSGDKTEIIIVDDGSRDGCCRFLQEKAYKRVRCLRTAGLGAARARNLGAAAAGGAYLVFCDAHITVPEGWLEGLLETLFLTGVDAVSPAIGSLEEPASVGYGQTWNERLEAVWLPPPPGMGITAAPLLPGGCLAVRAAAFNRVGGFDRGFLVWGHEDVELSLKLWLFGYGLYVVPSVKILHLFRKSHPYPVSIYHAHYNLLRLACSHFNYERVERVLELVKTSGQSRELTAGVLRGSALEQRLFYFARRKYDDDWFMQKFGINF